MSRPPGITTPFPCVLWSVCPCTDTPWLTLGLGAAVVTQGLCRDWGLHWGSCAGTGEVVQELHWDHRGATLGLFRVCMAGAAPILGWRLKRGCPELHQGNVGQLLGAAWSCPELCWGSVVTARQSCAGAALGTGGCPAGFGGLQGEAAPRVWREGADPCLHAGSRTRAVR